MWLPMGRNHGECLRNLPPTGAENISRLINIAVNRCQCFLGLTMIYCALCLFSHLDRYFGTAPNALSCPFTRGFLMCPSVPIFHSGPCLQLATCPTSLERVPLSPLGLLSRIHEDPHRCKSRSHLAHQEQSHVLPSQILGMPGSQYEKLSFSCCERPAITSLSFWVSQA